MNDRNLLTNDPAAQQNLWSFMGLRENKGELWTTATSATASFAFVTGVRAVTGLGVATLGLSAGFGILAIGAAGVVAGAAYQHYQKKKAARLAGREPVKFFSADTGKAIAKGAGFAAALATISATGVVGAFTALAGVAIIATAGGLWNHHKAVKRGEVTDSVSGFKAMTRNIGKRLFGGVLGAGLAIAFGELAQSLSPDLGHHGSRIHSGVVTDEAGAPVNYAAAAAPEAAAAPDTADTAAAPVAPEPAAEETPAAPQKAEAPAPEPSPMASNPAPAEPPQGEEPATVPAQETAATPAEEAPLADAQVAQTDLPKDETATVAPAAPTDTQPAPEAASDLPESHVTTVDITDGQTEDIPLADIPVSADLPESHVTNVDLTQGQTSDTPLDDATPAAAEPPPPAAEQPQEQPAPQQPVGEMAARCEVRENFNAYNYNHSYNDWPEQQSPSEPITTQFRMNCEFTKPVMQQGDWVDVYVKTDVGGIKEFEARTELAYGHRLTEPFAQKWAVGDVMSQIGKTLHAGRIFSPTIN